MRASAPARLARGFFEASREFFPFGLSPPVLASIVSFDALLLHHPFFHRSWICFGAHWYTRICVGWLVNPGWYLHYRLFGCRYKCRLVGDRYVGCRSGRSCVFYTQHENIDDMQSKASTSRGHVF